MKLGQLQPPQGATKESKRLGRGQGSGHGGTSGRGHKGAHSRSGDKQRPWFEGGQMPLQRRLPKRGFSNYPFKKQVQVLGLDAIERLQKDEVDIQVLLDAGLIRNARIPVKILANGEITKAVKIAAHAFSKTAVEKIEKAGGTVTYL